MDKNTIFGLLIILAILFGYSAYNNSKVQKAKKQQMEELAEQMAQDSTTITIKTDSVAGNTNDDFTAMPAPQADNNFATAQAAADYFVETNLARYTFSSIGGYIKKIEFKDIYAYTPKDSAKKNLVLFDGNDNSLNLNLTLKNQKTIKTKDLLFVSEIIDTLIVTEKGEQLVLRAHPVKTETGENGAAVSKTDSGSYIEYVYTFNPDDFRFGFRVNLVNMSQYLYANSSSFSIDWEAALNNVEKNYEYERDITTIYYMDNTDDVDNLEERKPDKKEFASELKWVGFKQQFFTSVLIADSANFSSGFLKVSLPDKSERHLLKEASAQLEFPIRDLDHGSFDMSFYYGPNQYKLLKEYDLNLERQVPLGWSFLLHWINRIAIIPIFNWLEAYGINYGIIILILTIIIKTILFPVAYKTYMSSAKMRVLKPELMEISARYPKQEDAMKKQQATMSLYKKAGVSPMSGCLPMLFQFPILVAMFRFFPSAYELRQQSFLWAEDLSTYDSILDFSFNIPFYGDHVSLFCLLMTIATLFYTWLNNRLMAPTGDEQQQKMMKWMMYIMPILFLPMFNSFSSALTYYYLLVNIITFIQMGIFRYAVNEDKLRAKLKANMEKPVKKSKWEKKLEEMQRQQQQMMRQQQKKR
ncbi:MAG: membrane protein insertase YidC [Bacteroidales bacterium]|nr:membrane protein insertase YidC [Bacteroidales bacterium]